MAMVGCGSVTWLWGVGDRYYCVSDADGRRHDFCVSVRGGEDHKLVSSPIDG